MRWLADDIGRIEVQLGDEWHAVPTVLAGFDGRSAVDWIAAQRLIRRGNPYEREVAADTVARALAEIDALNSAAGSRVGLIDERWDATALERLEQQISIGFINQDVQETGRSNDGLYGEKVEAPSKSKARNAVTGKSAPRPERKWKF